MSTTTIEAFAKVNLTLDVFGRRTDGYHELRSVVLPVTLADEVTVEDSDELTSDTGYSDDLCLRAAQVLRPLCAKPYGACIRVSKRIPVGGGLGGGSADAAATMRALNDLWQLGLSRERLAQLGVAVGSDVPSLVLGGPVLMEGRGERVRRIVCARSDCGGSGLHLVLANPGVFCSTAEVYARCTARTASGEGATDMMVDALARGDFAGVVSRLSNDLQQPALACHPEIGAALRAMREEGASGVLMSGSGSTVFGLVPDAETARRLAVALAGRGLRAWPVTACA